MLKETTGGEFRVYRASIRLSIRYIDLSIRLLLPVTTQLKTSLIMDLHGSLPVSRITSWSSLGNQCKPVLEQRASALLPKPLKP